MKHALQIDGGLLDHQVLQRNDHNVCEATLYGQIEESGTLQYRYTTSGRKLTGPFHRLATLRRGQFTVKLTGIPVGGPYDIELQLTSKEITFSRIVRDVLVGDVWILAGQSNMQGCGLLATAEPKHPRVRAFYMDDRWAMAKDPIHNLNRAVDEIHIQLCGGPVVETPSAKRRPVKTRSAGAGPGVSFGKKMADYTGVPQGLIACAHGGTSMSQWDPQHKEFGKSLYGAMLRRLVKNGRNVKGVLWYQGCSDADTDENITKYTDRMIDLVASIRRDFARPDLPVIAVQIATCHTYDFTPERWNQIQNQQRLLPQKIKSLTVVPAIDLPLDDHIHLSGAGQRTLGRRLAEAAWTLLNEKGKKQKTAKPKKMEKTLLPPLELAPLSIRIDKIPPVTFIDIAVPFKHVEGTLTAPGRPAGFTLFDAAGREVSPYQITLDGPTVHVRISLVDPIQIPDNHFTLCYAPGLKPYCNITDQKNRALPAFQQPIILNLRPK